ncbi:GAF domain-containing serine/threonine-protein kinase [Frigoribacterium sp. UYMn621]|uniref:GAF domain-containing serine/threonine-protein kinase n=1 Tax=Frigoribacterium sp. UYMn621 TaxID=3156343 RepID=UPI00339498AF
MAVPTAGNMAGRLLGARYRVESTIGFGGMATVYRATDEVLGRAVAVKLFDSNTLDPARQESELAVLASLDHHGVVNLYDAGLDTDDSGRTRRYLIMALVTGQNLHERIQVSPIASRHIAEIGYDMAEALEYIHARNVLHRDIKPSNILLVDYGDDAPRARAKLTDFGIALSDDIERMTAEGETTGTAAYLSPEQVTGTPLTAASDVYSLGLVLLQSFTRAIEFPGSMVESAMARLSRDPAIPEFLPDHWRDLLSAMTARDPAQRPQGRELVSLLRQTIIADSARHKDAESDIFSPGEPHSSTGRAAILDTIPDEALHRVTAMAARLFSAPISIVSVVDHDRTWFRSHYGPEVEQIARAVDLRTATIPHAEPVIIEDGQKDPRSQDSHLVTGALGLRFYVGVPLKRSDGQTIGTLSVLDFVPRSASDAEVANLQDLAALVVAQLETRHEGLRTVEMTGPMMAVAPQPEGPSAIRQA